MQLRFFVLFFTFFIFLSDFVLHKPNSRPRTHNGYHSDLWIKSSTIDDVLAGPLSEPWWRTQLAQRAHEDARAWHDFTERSSGTTKKKVWICSHSKQQFCHPFLLAIWFQLNSHFLEILIFSSEFSSDLYTSSNGAFVVGLFLVGAELKQLAPNPMNLATSLRPIAEEFPARVVRWCLKSGLNEWVEEFGSLALGGVPPVV